MVIWDCKEKMKSCNGCPAKYTAGKFGTECINMTEAVIFFNENLNTKSYIELVNRILKHIPSVSDYVKLESGGYLP